MPLFNLDIEKSYGGRFWTNRYVLDGDDITGLVSVADVIADQEVDVHLQDIAFTKYRLSDRVPGTDVFIVVPLGTNGARISASPVLPLFNVARVDFGVGVGRPSRKYLRVGLTEADVNGDTIGSTLLTALEAYGAALVSLPAFVDVDGQAITSATAQPLIQMRQLRRGTRRPTTPVI